MLPFALPTLTVGSWPPLWVELLLKLHQMCLVEIKPKENIYTCVVFGLRVATYGFSDENYLEHHKCIANFCNNYYLDKL